MTTAMYWESLGSACRLRRDPSGIEMSVSLRGGGRRASLQVQDVRLLHKLQRALLKGFFHKRQKGHGMEHLKRPLSSQTMMAAGAASVRPADCVSDFLEKKSTKTETISYSTEHSKFSILK